MREEPVPAARLGTRSRRRKPSRIAEIRRGELIEAAIRDISANGYDRVTVASICEEAGFSRGLIGHYFDSKDALLFAAVKTVSDRLGRALQDSLEEAGPHPADRLRALVSASFTPPGCTPDNVAVWVALVGAAKWSRPLSKLYRAIWNAYRSRLRRVIAEVAETEGREVDLDSASLLFSQLIEGFWIGCHSNPGAVTPERAEEISQDYFSLLFGRLRGAKSR